DTNRGTSSSGAALSTTGSSTAVTPGGAAGAVGREPETSGEYVAATDSLVGADSGCPADRLHTDAPSFPHQAPTVGLQRSGVRHSNQRRISLHGGPAAAFQEAADPARSERQSQS